MTRQAIIEAYAVDANGIIREHGTFEGEALYVVHFWEAYLDGCADSDDGRILTFNITPEDRQQFPEIPKRKRVIKLTQREDGFVCEL